MAPSFLSSRFLVGFVGWHDLLESIRLDLTAILISKRNVSICLHYLNVRWLILPRRYITSFFARGGTLFSMWLHDCHVNYIRYKPLFILI